MSSTFEQYLDSPAADTDFDTWWHNNPDAAPDRHTARGVWEQTDEAYEASRRWAEDRHWDRKLREVGL